MSRKKEEVQQHEEFQQEISRIQLPRGRQVFGILEQRVGASRVMARCFDGKERVCRIPGRLKRKLWVREGDLIIVEPWEFSGDERGDVLFKYSNAQVEFLKRRGHLKQMEAFEEF